MSRTLRTAQPLLEEKQLMLVSAMAQQSCFTARNYFVQPQLIHSCCACWRWVPAAAQVLTPCSDPSGAQPRAGAQEETKVQRASHGQWPNWSPVQRINSALVVALFQFRLPGLRQYRPTAIPSHNCSAWGMGRTPNYTTAQLLTFNRGKKTARGRFSSFRWGTCPSLSIWKSDILVFSSW